jgi:hypothetical protein
MHIFCLPYMNRNVCSRSREPCEKKNEDLSAKLVVKILFFILIHRRTTDGQMRLVAMQAELHTHTRRPKGGRIKDLTFVALWFAEDVIWLEVCTSVACKYPVDGVHLASIIFQPPPELTVRTLRCLLIPNLLSFRPTTTKTQFCYSLMKI